MDAQSSNIKGRQPIIPLSLENADLARSKEFIFDFINNIAYIKLVDGTLFNVTESESSLNYVKQYLIDNPDIILNVVIKSEASDNKTFQESIDYIYDLLDKLEKREFNYAGSKTDGGPANKANKVNHSITLVSDSGSIEFNGEKSKSLDIGTATGLFKNTGGYINGPFIPKNKFLLANGFSYGKTLPTTGVEGQLFILLKEEV